jgi:hypothetical protein
MSTFGIIADRLHRTMHRLPGMPDHAEAAARHARAAARARAWQRRMNHHPHRGGSRQIPTNP